MSCFLLGLFAVLLPLAIVGVISLGILRPHRKQITTIANGGMIASSRRRREMIHAAGRKAMEDFNKGVK